MMLLRKNAMNAVVSSRVAGDSSMIAILTAGVVGVDANIPF